MTWFRLNTIRLEKDMYYAHTLAETHGRHARHWITRGNVDKAAQRARDAFHYAAYVYDRYMAQKERQP